MNTLIKGMNAPDFSLEDQEGNTVTLHQFNGKNKVLVYFYPKAMTPGCTTQACSLRDNETLFDAFNVKVIGMSPDPVSRLNKFALRDRLSFILLSDSSHQIADAYGVWGEKKFMGKVFDGIHRVSFLIDEKGIIEKVFNGFKTKEHHSLVLEYLKEQKRAH